MTTRTIDGLKVAYPITAVISICVIVATAAIKSNDMWHEYCNSIHQVNERLLGIEFTMRDFEHTRWTYQMERSRDEWMRQHNPGLRLPDIKEIHDQFSGEL